MNLLQDKSASTFLPSSSTGMILSVTPTFSKAVDCWLVDSGASTHVACSLNSFESYQFVKDRTVTLPDKTTVPVIAVGSVSLAPNLILKNVSYIPAFNFNLLSVSSLLTDNKFSVTFFQNHFEIQEMPHSKKIGRGSLIEGLYVLSPHQLLADSSFPNKSVCCNLFSISANNTCTNASLWHSRFGHLSDKVLKILSNKIPFSVAKEFNSSHCTICPLAKFRRLSFPNSNYISDSVFDLLHCDIWGPYGHSTYDGKRYFLTLVDDCSRFTWLYLLKQKSDAAAAIIKFFTMIKTQFGKTIKCLRSDNARELALTDFLQAQGTLHQFSCVERPQQNSVVERKHQHLLNVARALYFQSKVPIAFWGECVAAATYIINRLPSPVLSNKVPFQVLYEKDPDYHALRSFGCLAFAATLTSTRNKFSPRTTPSVFMGYPSGYKGYKLFNLETKQFFISRDVTFIKDIFPFHSVRQVIDENVFSDPVIPMPISDLNIPNITR